MSVHFGSPGPWQTSSYFRCCFSCVHGDFQSFGCLTPAVSAQHCCAYPVMLCPLVVISLFAPCVLVFHVLLARDCRPHCLVFIRPHQPISISVVPFVLVPCMPCIPCMIPSSTTALRISCRRLLSFVVLVGCGHGIAVLGVVPALLVGLGSCCCCWSCFSGCSWCCCRCL